MKLTDIPSKQPVPFGVNGLREALLQSTPAGDNKASYANGFPPVTMTQKSAGGIPPKGQDMNQILFELSDLCRWFSAGGAIPFDSSFCSAISGYPKGSRVIGNDGITVYISTIESNTNNPNNSSTGWLSLSKLFSIASLIGGADKLPYFSGIDEASQTNFTQVGRSIIGQSSIDGVLSYLGLGSAANRNVGTSPNQIPDMSSFSSQSSINGYMYFPNGLIVQWLNGVASLSGSINNFPIPFPNSCLSIVLSHYGETPSNVGGVSTQNYTKSSFKAYSSQDVASNQKMIAIGF